MGASRQIDTYTYQTILLLFSIFVLVLSALNFSYYNQIVTQYNVEPNVPQDVGQNWAVAMKWINLSLIILTVLLIFYSLYKFWQIYTGRTPSAQDNIARGALKDTENEIIKKVTDVGASSLVADASATAATISIATSIATSDDKSIPIKATNADVDKINKDLIASGATSTAVSAGSSAAASVVASGGSSTEATAAASAAASAADAAASAGAPPAVAVAVGTAAGITAVQSSNKIKKSLEVAGIKVKESMSKFGVATKTALIASGKSVTEASKLTYALLSAIEAGNALPDWFIALQTKYYIRNPEWFYQQRGYNVKNLATGGKTLGRDNGYVSTAVSPTLIGGTIGTSVNAANAILDKLETTKNEYTSDKRMKETGELAERKIMSELPDFSDYAMKTEDGNQFCGSPDLLSLNKNERTNAEFCASVIQKQIDMNDANVKYECNNNNFEAACYIAKENYKPGFRNIINNNCNDPSASALPESRQNFCKAAIRAKRDNPEVYEACYVNNQFENACNTASNLVALDEYAAADARTAARFAMRQASMAAAEV